MSTDYSQLTEYAQGAQVPVVNASAEGKSFKKTASELGLNERTVSRHAQKVGEKAVRQFVAPGIGLNNPLPPSFVVFT